MPHLDPYADEDVPFYARANISVQGLSDLRRRLVQDQEPAGEINENTEAVWVNGIRFINPDRVQIERVG